MIITIEKPAARCPLCGDSHPPGDEGRGNAVPCDALRDAGDAGARPPGVPIRVQAAYVEARQALRADAPALAIGVLQWLLSHLAELRGVNPALTLAAKVAALTDAGLVAKTVRRELIEQALANTPSPETAWALMTLAEHALARAYLRRSGA